ncbi:MAPEG family protein [Aestuariibacter halophilus]|uniref:MAPEG family protein n=1 Tax=Fluctibacter halophilus TaxID=226011 RepID=A0ABS8G8D7_9ALTE|nr:MAPEG family protein [Aestuariibacter halophilus]MCC2616810.1 MAPEG family protein [Aestuariibacter halophilus]
MYSATVIALLGFIAWTLVLLVAMEVIRSKLVMTKAVAANQFNPSNTNLSPFMQRLARAHANCIEGLPLFGGLMVVAILTDNTAITDPLAWIFLAARIAQSLLHLSSLSVTAVTLRFSAFAVQVVIALVWCYQLAMVMAQ